MDTPIKIYAVNLPQRADRRASIESQFADKPEFELHVVPAIERRIGAHGLWQTFYGIVAAEVAKDSEYFIFCEDDHIFTEDYSFDLLLSAINNSRLLGAELVSGGMSILESPLQVTSELFWVSDFNGTQFIVIFKRLYEKILACRTVDGYTLDRHLSSLAKRKYVIFPYISIQQEFGYSDATPKNNMEGRVSSFFQLYRNTLSILANVRRFYANINAESISKLKSINIDCSYIPTYIIKQRDDSTSYILQQFSNRDEFNINIIEITDSLDEESVFWDTICHIVSDAKNNDDDFILICDNNHSFTENYDKEQFLHQILIAGYAGAELLSGGTPNFGNIVPLWAGLSWVDWFWRSQFLVIFRKAYDAILDAKFYLRDKVDDKLSSLLKNKFITTPFVSEYNGIRNNSISNNRLSNILRFAYNTNIRLQSYMFALNHTDPCSVSIQSYLNQKGPHKLHLGCRHNILDGWLNTDMEPTYGATFLDIMQPFPIPDNTFLYIFAEHIIEKLSIDTLTSLLKECYRTLVPGGVLRISFFSIENIFHSSKMRHMYADFWRNSMNDSILSDEFVTLNTFAQRTHGLYTPDYVSIHNLATILGFTQITKCDLGISTHTNLCNIDNYQYFQPLYISQIETLSIELTKPIN